mmetsp:Transcript_11891/g.39398  ORF Transcript_11891/g.39398 Transcript_11891/m.39398 type:complete len:201 (-) Transcript_11891:1405-2007(-)
MLALVACSASPTRLATPVRARVRMGSSAEARAVQPLPALPALSGPVLQGYGRGSAKLGFPTANLPCSLFQDRLVQLERGVYLGWAALGGDVRKCVANIGISPSFVGEENAETIVEAHVIAEDAPLPADFYGKTLRLLLLGFVRPERKFDFTNGPGELIAAIGADVATATAELDRPPFAAYRDSAWLTAPSGEPSFDLLDP